MHCPECGARFTARRELLAGRADLVLLCGACGCAFDRNAIQTSAEVVETAAAAALAGVHHRLGGPRVVVGFEIPSAQRAVADVLRQAGYSPVVVSSGEQVIAACDPVMPEPVSAVVLDVAIAGVLAFEAIQAIRAFPNGDAIPIVLLASVYERTRYKRRPNRLYGADSYLELHHVPDQLGLLLNALFEHKEPPASRVQTPTDRARTAPLRSHDDGGIDREHQEALARRLISDVALYNGNEIAAGVQEEDPLRDVHTAVAAAREHFIERLGALADADVFDAQVEAFVHQLVRRDVAHEGDSKSSESATT